MDAAKTKLQAELERRKKEWLVEDEVADAEVAEIEKEEVVNEIKVQQVEKEQKNIEREILRSEEIYDVLSEKFTNNDLYIWLEKELGKVFRQYVKTLLEVAQMAEKAYHFEIEGDSTKPPEFMAGDYWETFYKGLLAPERILLDLRRMEKAYLENDEHEMEITRPIRLSNLVYNQINCLETLKADGSCVFELSELLFKSDFANHKFRRIRNLWIKVESNTNDFANVELTLLESKLACEIDDAHETYASSLVNSNSDKYFNMFEIKRGLFEGRGVESKWSLSVTGISRNQITDVVIFLNYTARM